MHSTLRDGSAYEVVTWPVLMSRVWRQSEMGAAIELDVMERLIGIMLGIIEEICVSRPRSTADASNIRSAVRPDLCITAPNCPLPMTGGEYDVESASVADRVQLAVVDAWVANTATIMHRRNDIFFMDVCYRDKRDC